MNHHPVVTVGMAVYNGETHIREAITSIFAQDFKDWELVIVDDASSDRSIEVIHQFNDCRIRVFRNETNEGLVAVRNRIMTEARGDFIAWLDQDDLASPRRLSTQITFLQKNPYISICGSLTRMLVQLVGEPDRAAISILPYSHRSIRAAIPFFNPMACNTVMLRVNDFTKLSLHFRSEFGNSLDYDMWSRATDRLMITNLPSALGTYRRHPQQTSQGAALREMNHHALMVQVEIIQRILGISMTRRQIETHRAATIAPMDIPTLERLDAIAEWFSLLQAANRSQYGFDRLAFDQFVAQQWFTVLLKAGHQQDWRAVLQYVVGNARSFQFGIRPSVQALLHGLQRKRYQRFRGLPSERDCFPGISPRG